MGAFCESWSAHFPPERRGPRAQADQPCLASGPAAMPITDVRMQNFRSFSDETTLQFKRGLNVLVSGPFPTSTCPVLAS